MGGLQTQAGLLAAIEHRDREVLQKLYHPEIEFHWPPGLPYSGVFKGVAIAKMQECFASIWLPLQPTEERRRMDPRVLATDPQGRVIINYIWKGLSSDGVRALKLKRWRTTSLKTVN